ncbi:MAG: DUF192 domain-containing protein, partial [Chloroflexota bacterium]
RIHVVVALTAILVAAACGPASRHERRVVLVGDERWTVLLAGADGMRGSADFDGADGMLFDLDRDTDPGAVRFVMDGVVIPLDIAWFAADGRLVGTATMDPCPATPCPVTSAPGPYRWAIEAPAGAFADLGSSDRLDAGSLP